MATTACPGFLDRHGIWNNGKAAEDLRQRCSRVRTAFKTEECLRIDHNEDLPSTATPAVSSKDVADVLIISERDQMMRIFSYRFRLFVAASLLRDGNRSLLLRADDTHRCLVLRAGE